MTGTQQLSDDVGLRRYEYDDETVLAADLGPSRDASVDVLDDAVIVVVDDEQYDLELAGDAQAFIRNGVLTIEVDA
ncbi:DUF7127 family protein [Halosimplex salinum]|uniref:DUF7127 family protein n=1 Tax=Halosimplex salinum TaxID=1710538 RepID=UPI000F466CDB|nr:hypothetical protein [Halosimplex salinum]